MKTKIIKYSLGTWELVAENQDPSIKNPRERRLVLLRVDSNFKKQYKITDWRLTKWNDSPDECLEFSDRQSIMIDGYPPEIVDLVVDFPVEKLYTPSGIRYIWLSGDGVLIEGHDIPRKQNEKPHSYLWTKKTAMRITKEIQAYWEKQADQVNWMNHKIVNAYQKPQEDEVIEKIYWHMGK